MDLYKNWKRCAASVAAAVVAAGLISGCGLLRDIGKPSADSGTGTTPQSGQEREEKQERASSIRASIPEDSILFFENDPGLARLLADMETGEIPVECDILYDEEGARPEVAVKDPGMIRELFDRLSRVTVGSRNGMSVTDAWHYMSFRLRNDTNVVCFFNGEGLLLRGQDTYTISGAGPLFTYIRKLQDDAVAMEKARASQQGAEASSGSDKSSAGSSKKSAAKKESSKEDESREKSSDKESSGNHTAGGTAAQDRDGQTLSVIQYPSVPLDPWSEDRNEAQAEAGGKAETEKQAADQETKPQQEDTSSGARESRPQQTDGQAEDQEIPSGQSDTRQGTIPADPAETGKTAESESPAAAREEGTTASTASTASAASETADKASTASAAADKASTASAAADKASTASAAADKSSTASTAADKASTASAAAESAGTAAAAVPAEGDRAAAADRAYIMIEGAYAKYLSMEREEFLGKYENGTLGKAEDASEFGEMEKLLNYDVLRDYFAEPENNGIYSARHDYDGDSTPELVIAIGYAEYRQIRAVYTFDGSRAVSLFQGEHALGERTALYTLPDRTFLYHASGGAAAGGDMICRIAEGGTGLEVLAEYEYDEQKNGTTDHIGREETLTDEQFREKYQSKAKKAEDGLDFRNMKQ